MTDYGNYDDVEDEDLDDTEKKKKKGGKTETDRQGREQVQATDGYYTYMNSIGASKSLIAEIFRNWRHLSGEGLLRAIRDFAQRMSSRATVYVEVEIDKKKDYGLLHNLLQFFKGTSQSPVQRQGLDQKNMDPK